MPTYQHTTILPDATARELYAWHVGPGALERLLPPASGVRIVRGAPVAEGSEVELSVPMGPFRRRWLARHSAIVLNASFTDAQISGPFAAWSHVHRFADVPGGARLTDDLTYTPPGGPFANIVDAWVASELRRTFAWRHERTRRDLVRHRVFAALPRLTVGVSGATGLVGSALSPFLRGGGHTVVPFVRRGATEGIAWDPPRGRLDEAALANCDAVVHLAGSSVAKRWTPTAMAEIRDSRVAGTRLVAEAIARQQAAGGRTKTLIIASGVNIYPSGVSELNEDSPTTGDGFLAEVVRAWEAAAEPARAAGVRVVHLRIGMVLSPAGGGLAQLLMPAKCGLGGPVAGGEQYISWIDLDDLVGLIHHALLDRRAAGVINACAPEPVRQGHFAEVLGAILHRPAFAPFPACAVRLLLGHMGEELLLPSVRVVSKRTAPLEFAWSSPDLATALRFQLGRW